MAKRYDANSSGTAHSSLPTATSALGHSWVMTNEQSSDRGLAVRMACVEAEDVLARISAFARAQGDLRARIDEFEVGMRDLGESIPLVADVMEASNEVKAENRALLAERDEQRKFQTRLLEENAALKGIERRSKHWYDQAFEFWVQAERAWDIIEKERKEKREVEVAYRRLMDKAVDVEEVLRERVAKLKAEVDVLRRPMTKGNSWREIVLTAALTAILLSLIR